MEHAVVGGAQARSSGDLSLLLSAWPAKASQERRWVFDLFVVAAPWEFAEINALLSWRNEWLCLTSFVKCLGNSPLLFIDSWKGAHGAEWVLLGKQNRAELDLVEHRGVWKSLPKEDGMVPATLY